MPEYAVVQRSFSFSGRTYKRSESCSRSQTRTMSGLSHVAKRQRQNSIHLKLHLTHSQSAPSIGMDPWRRRHSLQHLDSYGTGETWETDTEVDGINPTGKPLLRRTSSEVYVDRGELYSGSCVYIWLLPHMYVLYIVFFNYGIRAMACTFNDTYGPTERNSACFVADVYL